MTKTLSMLYALLASMNPAIAALMLGVVSATAVIKYMNDTWIQLIAKVDAMTASSFAGTLSVSPFGLVDTFMPLHEALSFFTAWLGVLVVCSTIRILKSFIPTIAT